MSSPNRIHPLPLQLANQIAAGEVVERPASVIKELIENSLDAGATEIEVQIEGAGIQLMRVRDNGAGIHPEDLPLALSRHATSKISSSDELSHIASLGFRGEALPSISSVSRVLISSRQAESDKGWQIDAATNEVLPAAHPLGTSVEVRDLFFNLPARRRFLRSEKTELQHISNTLHRLALSRFDVGFDCQLSPQIRLKLPAVPQPEKQVQRIAKLCGQAFLKHSAYIEQEYQDIRLHGWLGNEHAHRAQTDVQYFFINGRVIRDKVINHAIRQAYGDRIPAGRQAAYVLYMTLPLDKVDVNVHPTKHEVRFRDARLLHGLITHAIEDALAQQPSDDVVELGAAQPGLALEEHANNYQIERDDKVTRPAPAPQISPTISNYHRIADRYVLVKHQYSDWLIDLHRAAQAHAKEQWQQAINENNLASRRILVPFSLVISAEQQQLIESYQAYLEQCGFAWQLNDNSLTVKAIPALLAGTELKQLMDELFALLDKSQQQNSGSPDLSQLLPNNTDFSHQQVEKLLTELLPQLDEATSWCSKLDQQSLSSLFSSSA
jgi:DNA mismatch repair protein MutL